VKLNLFRVNFIFFPSQLTHRPTSSNKCGNWWPWLCVKKPARLLLALYVHQSQGTSLSWVERGAVRSEPLLFKKLQTFTIFYASITPKLVLFISVPLNCLKLTSPEWMFFLRVHEKKIGRNIIRICCSFSFSFSY